MSLASPACSKRAVPHWSRSSLGSETVTRNQIMNAFEIPSIFPLEITDAERQLGFVTMEISLAGFTAGQSDTTFRLVARRLSESDVALKMLHNGQIRYRLARHGYRKCFGLRLPWIKPKWHSLTTELFDEATVDASGMVSDVVPVAHGF